MNPWKKKAITELDLGELDELIRAREYEVREIIKEIDSEKKAKEETDDV